MCDEACRRYLWSCHARCERTIDHWKGDLMVAIRRVKRLVQVSAFLLLIASVILLVQWNSVPYSDEIARQRKGIKTNPLSWTQKRPHVIGMVFAFFRSRLVYHASNTIFFVYRLLFHFRRYRPFRGRERVGCRSNITGK